MIETITDNWPIALAIFVVSVGLIGFELNARRWKRIVEKTLSSRLQLSSEEFGKTFFGETSKRAVIAKELREIVAKHLPVSMNGLQPEDKFQETLKMDKFDSLTSIEIVMEIEERFVIKQVNDDELKPDLTFRQLVDLIERRVVGK